MGCGVFAGGVSHVANDAAGKNSPKRSKYNLELITYDPVSKQESREDFPRMRGRKIRPLVFELFNKLHVMDTSSSVYNWSFESLCPLGNFWDPIVDPFSSRFAMKKEFSGRTPYAWFLAGDVISICAHRTSRLFFSDAKHLVGQCFVHVEETLPFQGMATTYFDPHFSDVVVISFSGGCVEGRRLKFRSPYLGTPTVIFNTQPGIPEGELSSYFANCGDGVFCLATFDNAIIHVYIFKISRLPDDGFPELKLDLMKLCIHKYRFSDFSFELNRSVSISGCFALPSVDQAKRTEAAKFFVTTEEDDEDDEDDEDVDYTLCYETEDGYVKSRIDWPSENSDSDDPETDVAGY